MFAFNQNQMHSKKEHILELEATQRREGTTFAGLQPAFVEKHRPGRRGKAQKEKGMRERRKGSTERLKN